MRRFKVAVALPVPDGPVILTDTWHVLSADPGSTGKHHVWLDPRLPEDGPDGMPGPSPPPDCGV